MSTNETQPVKLDGGHKNIMRLCARDAGADGWASCSKPVFKMLQSFPKGLFELEPVGDEGRGRARLTEQGQSILDAMAWL